MRQPKSMRALQEINDGDQAGACAGGLAQNPLIKEWRGLWLPAGETHLIEWMQKVHHIVEGRPTYQYNKLSAALKFCKQRRVAVDVGAHCGLWSMHLVREFGFVHAFEPVEVHRECFRRNVGASNHALYACALGDKIGTVSIHTAPTSSGDSWVDGDGDITMRRLDEFDLQDVDLLKLDCEGYELFALKGAEEMLLRCKPCVIVEQKPGRAQKFGLPEIGAVDYLRTLGAHLRTVMSGDFILAWD